MKMDAAVEKIVPWHPFFSEEIKSLAYLGMNENLYTRNVKRDER